MIALATAIVLMLVLDAAWLTINKRSYDRLVRGVQRSPLNVKLAPAATAYALMVVALAFLVLPAAKAARGSRLERALRYGALFGFVAYGIFNATNAAIFESYDWRVAILDTAWGTTLFAIATYVALH